MKIVKAQLFHLKLPLKFMFKTAKTGLNIRETLVVKLIAENGIAGYGECVAFTEAFYTNETLGQAKQILQNEYLPLLLRQEIQHPFDIHQVLDHQLPMTVAAIENALLDLYGKQQKQNCLDLVFPETKNPVIPMGMTLGDLAYAELHKQIAKYQDLGCKRFKIKISPRSDSEMLAKLMCSFPKLDFLVDANRSFQIDQLEELQAYDSLKLLCIEEPFHFSRPEECQGIQQLFTTPICLDESIQSLADLKQATSLNLLKMINIKIGRLGGLFYVRQIVDFCREQGIGFWIGSMLESGISKILHTQLASLTDNVMAGDLSDSTRYFEHDLIRPAIIFNQGSFRVPMDVGIGVQIDQEKLIAYAIDVWEKEYDPDEFSGSTANK